MIYAGEPFPIAPAEALYPCQECNVLRTKAEKGHIYTVCDACWKKNHEPSPKVRKRYKTKKKEQP